jgi:hypothetical protein
MQNFDPAYRRFGSFATRRLRQRLDSRPQYLQYRSKMRGVRIAAIRPYPSVTCFSPARLIPSARLYYIGNPPGIGLSQ